jgi:hypothetical protein
MSGSRKRELNIPIRFGLCDSQAVNVWPATAGRGMVGQTNSAWAENRLCSSPAVERQHYRATFGQEERT